MKSLPAKIVVDAFTLSNARGADLLVRLGAFGVWQGDLATMRGDDPRASTAVDVAEPHPALADILTVARAIQLLQPVCRAALYAVHVEKKDPAALAVEMDTDREHARGLTDTCEQRLLEIYESLVKTPDEGAVPEWVSERDHAGASGHHR